MFKLSRKIWIKKANLPYSRHIQYYRYLSLHWDSDFFFFSLSSPNPRRRNKPNPPIIMYSSCRFDRPSSVCFPFFAIFPSCVCPEKSPGKACLPFIFFCLHSSVRPFTTAGRLSTTGRWSVLLSRTGQTFGQTAFALSDVARRNLCPLPAAGDILGLKSSCTLSCQKISYFCKFLIF